MKKISKNQKNVIISGVIVAVILSIILIVCQSIGSSPDNSAIDRLMAEANKSASAITTKKLNNFELTQKNIVINNKKYPYIPEILDSYEGDTIPELDNVPKEMDRLYKNAKDMVISFVKEYFPKNSNNIVTRLESIPLVVGDFSISETLQTSSFVAEHGKVYMNKMYTTTEWSSAAMHREKDAFTEILTHELVHCIKQSIGTDDLRSTKIDEAMTDVIALAICQCDRPDIGYKPYRPYAYMLLDHFGIEALDSYFYGGYDKLMGKNKLQAFIMLAQVSGTQKMSDGLSDSEAYMQLAHLNSVNDIYAIGKQLL